MINIKKILHIDILHPVQSWRELKRLKKADFPSLFTHWWRKIKWRKLRFPKPSTYPRTRGPRWTGPRYLNSNSHREDLILVTEQIAALTRTNAPLDKGLKAAAKETIRLRPRFYIKLFYITLTTVFILVALSQDVIPFMPNASKVLFGWIVLVVVFKLTNIFSSRGTVFIVLSQRLNQGLTLSQAMGSMPRFFPQLYADLVQTGESCGNVADCLDQMNEDTLNTIQAHDTLLNNLLYFCIVVSIEFYILSFLAIKVFPVLPMVLGDIGANLPSSTRSFIYISNWIVYNWPKLLIQLSVLLLLLWAPYRFTIGRKRGTRGIFAGPFGLIFFVIPWFRGLFIKQNLAIAALILEKLLQSGATLTQALESVSNAAIHPLYQRKFTRIRERVEQGETLSEACGNGTGLPALPGAFRGFITLGENSGMMPDAIARIGQIYHYEASQRMRILSDAVLPFAVVALGYIILFAALSLFTPIFSISDFIIDQM